MEKFAGGNDENRRVHLQSVLISLVMSWLEIRGKKSEPLLCLINRTKNGQIILERFFNK
ncbi:hypothetical protein [Lyngbya sp. PCC 8106]|uniref:hypothetical protein n=1 Tax=Lyngbya sp. (strain PCC 8106) TaxID=313612 RepID=UPI0000EA9B0C|nr:hypothetical protein [Lyngbya sp. PCC 8106]EAW35841.1 hypothetical protein L8106_02662 [Lyngbya sp. PCC 8106]